MGKATEYGQQMILKPQYHSWFTFFTLNPVKWAGHVTELVCAKIPFFKKN